MFKDMLRIAYLCTWEWLRVYFFLNKDVLSMIYLWGMEVAQCMIQNMNSSVFHMPLLKSKV